MVLPRNAADVLDLEEFVPQARDILVAGGRFIGRGVGEQTGEYFSTAHRDEQIITACGWISMLIWPSSS